MTLLQWKNFDLHCIIKKNKKHWSTKLCRYQCLEGDGGFGYRCGIWIFLPFFGQIPNPWDWKYRKIPKISPRAYIFQRPFLRGLFLEGLIFGTAYIRRELCISKSARLILGGKFVSKSIGLGYSWKEIYLSNLQKVFTKTRLQDIDLSKT